MERRGSNTWLVAVLAVAVGFLIAWLVFRGDDNNNTSATVSSTTATTAAGAAPDTTTTQAGTTSSTTTTQAAAPQDAQPSVASCVDLWNEPVNRGDQTLLVNIMSHQPVRVHVGVTSDVPPKCLITVVANNGDAYVFPGAGGSTYPYAQAPSTTNSASLPAAQKTSNALEQRDGTLAAR